MSADAGHPHPRKIARFGWIPDLPDARDVAYAAPAPVVRAGLPARVDLRAQCPTVYDQGQLGSCTANAIAGAVQFDQMKQGKAGFTPSRLFIYYGERAIEGTTGTDSGARIRDGIKVVATLGAPPEADWPYDIARFAKKPPRKAYADAKKDLVMQYAAVAQDLTQMRGCLADGFPFVLGFTVYDAFEGDAVKASGVLDLPAAGERVVGGHAVLAVGYDDPSQRFIVRNSWGDAWGQAGYFTMPYAYLLSPKLANDFWTVRSVSGG